MRERSQGTVRLPVMYRRQPEYIDNNKQYFADPEDDLECRPTVTKNSEKPRRGKFFRKNRSGMLLGINLIFLGVVVYFIQTSFTSNDGILQRDGMKYEVRAKLESDSILVSATVTQTLNTSPLSSRALNLSFSLFKPSAPNETLPLTLLSGQMPGAWLDSQVLQAFLDLPKNWTATSIKDYKVRAEFRAEPSDLVVKTDIQAAKP